MAMLHKEITLNTEYRDMFTSLAFLMQLSYCAV